MLHIFTSPVFYRKRSLCPLMVFWLGELMPVFWPVELDLISLKGSAESNSSFWSVYGFSMPFGSHSSFRGVRRTYFHSCFKVALSA